ncbi:MAG: hypothetical protein ABR559_04965 [Gemmatimonadota bacterium]
MKSLKRWLVTGTFVLGIPLFGFEDCVNQFCQDENEFDNEINLICSFR